MIRLQRYRFGGSRPAAYPKQTAYFLFLHSSARQRWGSGAEGNEVSLGATRGAFQHVGDKRAGAAN